MKNIKKMKSEALKLSIKLAKSSGKILLDYQKKIHKLEVSVKVAQGVATKADLASEKNIIDGILKKFPEHEILAEESAYKKFQGDKEKYNYLKDREWVWVIDPLDGTNNFLNGLDYYAICISLVHFGNPIVGVVYRPSSGELFYATEKEGAFFKNVKKNSKALRLLRKKSNKPLRSSLLVTGFTTEKGEVFDQEFELFKRMMGKSRGIRRMGSAALDIVYVASGIFDAFWERGLAPWDMAASSLIASEAGVEVSDYFGQKFHPFLETILCARKPLKEEILYLFGKSL